MEEALKSERHINPPSMFNSAKDTAVSYSKIKASEDKQSQKAKWARVLLWAELKWKRRGGGKKRERERADGIRQRGKTGERKKDESGERDWRETVAEQQESEYKETQERPTESSYLLDVLFIIVLFIESYNDEFRQKHLSICSNIIELSCEIINGHIFLQHISIICHVSFWQTPPRQAWRM